MVAGPLVACALGLVVAASGATAGPERTRAAETPREVRGAPNLRLGLGLGLGLSGGLSLGVGLGVVLRHGQIYPAVVPARSNQAHVAAVNATNAGALMIGAGLGLGATALTTSLGARDRALWGELAGGGALAIAGAAWYVTEWQSVQKMLHDGGKIGPGTEAALLRREAAAASFVGAGIGLALGAGVALLTRHLVSRSRGAGRRVAAAGGGFGAGVLARF